MYMFSKANIDCINIKHVVLLALAVSPSFALEGKCDSMEIYKLCIDQESCDKCIQADPCCNWCYKKDYTGRKCNVLNRISNDCPSDRIEKNYDVNVTVSENETSTELSEFTQMQPKKFNVILRRDRKPVNISFTYTPVADYPLELYYLGDLSASMNASLEYMKNLGHDLPRTLTSLTKNFRIAYGSFMDKTGMPFYFTDPETLENPCLTMGTTCEKGYLFKHRLDFTEDMTMFSKKINASQVTANIDDLDGALDAILQILLCEERIRWFEPSRKIILLPTDSLLHTAGDGLLVGSVLRPTDKCLLDENGFHSQPLLYDYPTVEQIVTLLIQKKVNIIFAVKTDWKMAYYTKMSESLVKNYGFVGQLGEESENILDLIEKGYQNFAEQVNFYINSTVYEHLDVKFFADCDNVGRYNETSICYGVKNQATKFIAQMNLNSDDIDIEKETVYIEEKNIGEKIEILISYVGKCKCENLSELGLDCGHGEERCGKCDCDSNWTGPSCNESCDNTNIDSCRQRENGNISKICNSNGYCICEKCQCNSIYVGKFCEFQCPVGVNRQVCTGPQNGKCVDGKCVCEKGYTGETCSCTTFTDECDFGGIRCSAHGSCLCNKCECENTYSGKFCETSKANNTICDEYTMYLITSIANGTDRVRRSEHSFVVIEEIPSLDDSKGPFCEHMSFEGNSRCSRQFTYRQNGSNIHLPTLKTCTMTAGFGSMIGAIITILAVFLLGLVGICIQKLRIRRADHLEYKRFQAEQSHFNEMSPLYKSPVTQYENPMSRKNN